QSAHAAGELSRWRKHVGEGVSLVRQIVDIEEHRARDVRGIILDLCVAACLRQVPGRACDAHIWRIEALSKPFRRNKRRTGDHFSYGILMGCRGSANHPGSGKPFERKNSGLKSLLW